MSIHAHKIERMRAEFRKTINSVTPLNDWIEMFGYDSLDHKDKEALSALNRKIRKLSSKINYYLAKITK